MWYTVSRNINYIFRNHIIELEEIADRIASLSPSISNVWDPEYKTLNGIEIGPILFKLFKKNQSGNGT